MLYLMNEDQVLWLKQAALKGYDHREYTTPTYTHHPACYGHQPAHWAQPNGLLNDRPALYDAEEPSAFSLPSASPQQLQNPSKPRQATVGRILSRATPLSIQEYLTHLAPTFSTTSFRFLYPLQPMQFPS